MNPYFIAAAIVGFVVGVKLPIQYDLLISVGCFAGFFIATNKKGLEGLLSMLVALTFVSGIVAADVYVFIFFPEHRDAFMELVVKALRWMVTP